MAGVTLRTQVIDGVEPNAIPFDELMEAQRPAILKGLVYDWPLARVGMEGPARAIEYLKGFDRGQQIVGYTGAPEIKGRYFYDDSMTRLNFSAERVLLADYLTRMAEHLNDPSPPSFYIGSTDVDTYLPELRRENDLTLGHAMFAANPPIVSIWIGNRTVATAHFDQSNNLACCMVGRRRFTLFPPDQIDNLYPGPLELTPGGQVVSMVDFADPDFERFPRFREALAKGEVAELEPGDVLFYPAMWWHHVEALDPFNVLINYWWNQSPAFVDTPMTTLLHAILSLRDRPEQEKAAWRELFEYYVLGPAEHAGEHLPEHARGYLGPLDEAKARRLRAELLRRLNR